MAASWRGALPGPAQPPVHMTNYRVFTPGGWRERPGGTARKGTELRNQKI